VTDLLVDRDGPLLHVTFNRPAKRNAMTTGMYDALVGACELADGEAGCRAMVLTGAGAEAFVAGTDIAGFLEFTSDEDGVAYEAIISRVLGRLEAVRVPTIASIQGHCLGGGLGIATACDLRIATTTSSFGYPVARTLGNCLSVATLSALSELIGAGRTKDLLLRGRPMAAEEALAAGLVTEVVVPEELPTRTRALAEELASRAPLTQWATKEALRRLRISRLPDDTDIVRTVYGSADFHQGVRSFLAKTPPAWTGG
jgi:enoyl-CoA hydratase/carnithine racemase